MDSAGGTVKDARDKRFQAVYKLKGKPKNVFGLEPHKARNNDEIDDIVTILKCDTGSSFNLEKLKFNKIIILADADSDGKHIEMLATTMFGELTAPLIEAGRLYIAVSPLYRVIKDGHKLSYLRNEKDLNAYLVNEIESSFKFTVDEKEVSKKSEKEKVIGKIRNYLHALKLAAKKYNINPRIFESVFVQNFDAEGGEIDFGDRIEVTETTGDNVNIIGFYKGAIQEDFVCIVNVDGGQFVQDVSDLYEALAEIANYSFETTSRGKQIEGDSYFEVFNNLLDHVKKSVIVTRFKGWGEASAEDIWNSTLDPERRQLIQVLPGKDMKDTMKRFMGKDAEFRKEFLINIFNSTDTSDVLE
jgi:DNA gyrase subunit B